MVKPGKLLPPDPRPWTADPESRKTRKTMEKDSGGFDWGQAIALGMIGATVVFGIDKSLRKCEERHEEEEEEEEAEDRRRRRRERERSRGAGDGGSGGSGRRGAQSVAASYDRRSRRYYDDEGDERRRDDDGSRYAEDGRRYDEDEREWIERYHDAREASRAARDYSREPARRPESIRGLEKGDLAYVRDLERVEMGYGYGRGAEREYADKRDWEERRRSRSEAGSRRAW
ncbi:hypothetical protein C8034_v005843 [Colletotrichum sidae]|uniref:Uncharacterized protein n=1 Tax=Colletotrichum sidae TaxID=1347389 RepID=A0A4R8TQM6_9PEZI|nr:hypothetical protein C8034_v005843 [Colletotrichum sidae]